MQDNNIIQNAIDCLKRLHKENAELKAENERLKEEFEIESLTDNTTGETFYRSNKVNKLKEELATYGATGVCEVCSDKANKLADKYLGCLQEIKEIADTPSPFVDNLEIKSATEVEYDYAAICNELELRLHKVLELITKAEEE